MHTHKPTAAGPQPQPKATLTLTLSHRMGEGTGANALYPISAWFATNASIHSPSPVGRERAGVRAAFSFWFGKQQNVSECCVNIILESLINAKSVKSLTIVGESFVPAPLILCVAKIYA